MTEPTNGSGHAVITLDVLTSVLEDLGYATKVEPQDNGTFVLRNKINGLNTVTFVAMLEDGVGIESVQFYLGLSRMEQVTLPVVNAWNLERRFGKAFLDDEGNLSFVFDVMVFGDGVNRAYIDGVVRLWLSLLGTLFDFLREKTAN